MRPDRGYPIKIEPCRFDFINILNLTNYVIKLPTEPTKKTQIMETNVLFLTLISSIIFWTMFASMTRNQDIFPPISSLGIVSFRLTFRPGKRENYNILWRLHLCYCIFWAIWNPFTKTNPLTFTPPAPPHPHNTLTWIASYLRRVGLKVVL